MTDAPERIWLEDERPYGGICHVHNEPTEGVLKYGTPYILATPEAFAASPEVQALIAAARREGWDAAIEASAKLAHPPQWERKGKPGLWRLRRAKIAATIRALKEGTT